MDDQSGQESNSGAGCLLRLYWLVAGPAILFFLLAHILQKAPELLSLQDIGFFGVAASIIGVRYLDVCHYKGQTGYGEPATISQWRSYAVLVAAGTSALWLAVRILAHFWQ